jgi:hypothetical protein
MGVTFVICVTFVTNIIVMCHWSSNVSYEAFYEPISIKSGEGWVGGVRWAKSGSKAFGDYFVVSQRQKVYIGLKVNKYV